MNAVDRLSGQGCILIHVCRRLPEPVKVRLVPDLELHGLAGEVRRRGLGVVAERLDLLGRLRRPTVAARMIRVTVAENEVGLHVPGLERSHEPVVGAEVVGPLMLDRAPEQIHSHPAESCALQGVESVVVRREMDVRPEPVPQRLRALRHRSPMESGRVDRRRNIVEPADVIEVNRSDGPGLDRIPRKNRKRVNGAVQDAVVGASPSAATSCRLG